MDKKNISALWQPTLGDDGGDDWASLSGDATYRGPEESGGTLSAGQTMDGKGGGDPASQDDLIGLGGFELIEEIGRGGMGVVWRARQASLAREVAIKLIKPEADNERARRGFVAEALVNGVLDHPNIVPVHELGKNASGEAFLAMKLVGGLGSLVSSAKRRRPPTCCQLWRG